MTLDELKAKIYQYEMGIGFGGSLTGTGWTNLKDVVASDPVVRQVYDNYMSIYNEAVSYLTDIKNRVNAGESVMPDFTSLDNVRTEIYDRKNALIDMVRSRYDEQAISTGYYKNLVLKEGMTLANPEPTADNVVSSILPVASLSFLAFKMTGSLIAPLVVAGGYLLMKNRKV